MSWSKNLLTWAVFFFTYLQTSAKLTCTVFMLAFHQPTSSVLTSYISSAKLHLSLLPTFHQPTSSVLTSYISSANFICPYFLHFISQLHLSSLPTFHQPNSFLLMPDFIGQTTPIYCNASFISQPRSLRNPNQRGVASADCGN